ncbi:MAG: RNA polymerase sigma factor RpoD/SigA [Acidobacteriota bacterium]
MSGKTRQAGGSPGRNVGEAPLPEESDSDVTLAGSGDESDGDGVEVSMDAPAALVPAGETHLTRYDALSAYMREISRYPLLDAEEERRLGLAAQEGDRDAVVKLATSNLRLVVSVAMRYRNSWNNLLDLIQEGNVGLMKAIDRFDPHRGLRFSTYATWWIKAYMLKYLLDNWSLVRVGTSNARRKVFFNLKRERERLRLQGIHADSKMLAQRLDVTEQDVQEVGQALDAKDMSLDAPAAGEPGSERGRSLPSADPLPDEQVAEDESHDILRRQFARFAAQLPRREREVFTDRLASEDPATLQQLADRFGMTREGVRQVEKRVVARFREFVTTEMNDYDLDLAFAGDGA